MFKYGIPLQADEVLPQLHPSKFLGTNRALCFHLLLQHLFISLSMTNSHINQILYT